MQHAPSAARITAPRRRRWDADSTTAARRMQRDLDTRTALLHLGRWPHPPSPPPRRPGTAMPLRPLALEVRRVPSSLGADAGDADSRISKARRRRTPTSAQRSCCPTSMRRALPSSARGGVHSGPMPVSCRRPAWRQAVRQADVLEQRRGALAELRRLQPRSAFQRAAASYLHQRAGSASPATSSAMISKETASAARHEPDNWQQLGYWRRSCGRTRGDDGILEHATRAPSVLMK